MRSGGSERKDGGWNEIATRAGRWDRKIEGSGEREGNAEVESARKVLRNYSWGHVTRGKISNP